MAPRLLFITGPPGSGKTTIIERLHDHYKGKGVRVEGILTRESRAAKERVGFKLMNLGTGEEGWLARKQATKGPRIGSYHVETHDLERIGTAALTNAIRGDAQLVLVDEVGPMEMSSREFRAALSLLLTASKVVVATLRYDSRYPEVEEARRTSDTRTIQVTHLNRDCLPKEILVEVDAMLRLTGDTQL